MPGLPGVGTKTCRSALVVQGTHNSLLSRWSKLRGTLVTLLFYRKGPVNATETEFEPESKCELAFHTMAHTHL